MNLRIVLVLLLAGLVLVMPGAVQADELYRESFQGDDDPEEMASGQQSSRIEIDQDTNHV